MGVDQEQKYRCIECGKCARELYHDYHAGVIKIALCEGCRGVVDKYIEFDPVVILLDAFLLKRQAFRHVLYNTNLQFHWKLTLVFLLCDAYTKLFRRRDPRQGELKPDYVFYSALEWDLYAMFLMACAELAVCFFTIYLLVFVLQKVWCIENVKYRDVLRGILLSNFGKLLVVPAILWGQSDSLLYLWLTKTFVLAANVQAIRVVCGLGPISSFLVAGLGHLLQVLVGDWLTLYTHTSPVVIG